MPDSSNERANRRVKIVCTLGPASETPEKIQGLIDAGMNVARLNFSHGTAAFHRGLCTRVREGAKRAGRNVAVMQDLQGPKIRVGVLPKGGVTFKAGDTLRLYPESSEGGAEKSAPPAAQGGEILVPLPVDLAGPISKAVKKGARILFDDGLIATRVAKTSGMEIFLEVEQGGKLTSNKGMNLPGSPLPIPSCTEKDLRDLKEGLAMGVDAVALSFVRSYKDVEFVQDQIRKNSNHRPLVISKVEREEAVDSFESVIEVSDGILIARGDMAVEIGPDRVPVVQKQLIYACNELGVPIITATQMLESMVNSPTPTRAEASDVANAVFDGTDAVMLSAETASGQFPAETVRIMDQIIRGAEGSSYGNVKAHKIQPLKGSIVDSIQFSAARIAQHVNATAIVAITHSGTAARTLAKYRPETPIIALMDNENSLAKLAFSWGVEGVLIPEILSTDDLFQMIERVLLEHKLARNEDYVVVTAGIPSLRRGTTNMVKVHCIGAVIERASRKI
ncbi:MAG: pyruvate kinase [Bacteriovoracia bacterium]